MLSNDVAIQLHDRVTRGEVLSAAEQALLNEWYRWQDQEESAALAKLPSRSLPELQTQVETAVAQLLTVTHHIQALTAENERLRGEIVKLQLLERILIGNGR